MDSIPVHRPTGSVTGRFYCNWLLRNPEVHYRFYISPPLVLSSARAIQSLGSQPTSLKSILILSSHLHLGLPNGLLLSGFPTKTLYWYAILDCSISATCHAHLNRLDLRFLIMLGEEYNAFSSALCNILHSPVISQELFIVEG